MEQDRVAVEPLKRQHIQCSCRTLTSSYYVRHWPHFGGCWGCSRLLNACFIICCTFAMLVSVTSCIQGSPTYPKLYCSLSKLTMVAVVIDTVIRGGYQSMRSHYEVNNIDCVI